jgi:hypothetical protein
MRLPTWLVWLASLGLLLSLLRYFLRRKNHYGINFMLLCTATYGAWTAAELGVRTYQRIAHGVPFTRSYRYYPDPDLGWTGKQIFGDPASPKLKIMVLGDSYTDGLGVSDTKMYYGVIRESFDAETFVYGGIGYGTLQEYIVMDRYIDTVRPDLILLQVCTNDFINNQFEIERGSYFNNNLMMRPYLIGDTIVHRFPGFGGSVLWFLSSRSRAFSFVHLAGERALASLATRGVLRTVEADIAAQGVGFDGFRKAVETTRRIVAKMKRRAGNIPIVAFPVDVIEPYLGEFDRLFQAESIEFISDVPKVIAAQEARGSKLSIDGWHWNEEGQRICGRVLAAALASRPRVGSRGMLHSR